MVAVPETQSELDKWGVQPEARLVLAHGDDDDGDGDDGDDCDTDGDDGDNANASKLVRLWVSPWVPSFVSVMIIIIITS